MTGLLDLGPLTEDVKLGKYVLTVQGLTVEDIFYLSNTFPEVRALLSGQAVKLTPKQLMDNAPKALGAIIAASTGERGNKEAIARAARLTAAAQLRIIKTIFTLTFPEGVGPFVKELWDLQNSFAVDTPKAPQDQTEDSTIPSAAVVSAQLNMDSAAQKRFRPRRAH